MAGKGPRPKDVTQLAGHGAAKARTAGMKVYTAPKVSQPNLPPRYVLNPDTGKKNRVPWPAATKTWWATWGDEPLSVDFTATDWDFLLDTAQFHAALWGYGDLKAGSELRLRVAKMGATAEDRARLRITYAAADAADEERGRLAPSARDRRGPLKAV